MPSTFHNKSDLPVPVGSVFIATDTNPTDRKPVANVPPDIARMQQKFRESPVELPPGVDPKQTEVKPAQDVKLEDLSPEQQLEMVDSLKQFTQAFKAATETPPPTAKAEPSVEAPAEDKPEQLYSVCPQCNWNMSDKFAAEATEEEKERFVISVLGQTPFVGTTELLGGKLVITFRTITTNEEQRIERELLQSARDGHLTSTAEWLVKAGGWRLAFALQRVDNQAGTPVYVADDKMLSETFPSQVYELVTKQHIKHESLLHAIAKQYRLFRNKVEMLEANMATESFW